jgi:hypothetical protein
LRAAEAVAVVDLSLQVFSQQVAVAVQEVLFILLMQLLLLATIQ